VQIQRRMRLYQSKDMGALLDDHGIAQNRHLNRTLPLADFDSQEFETREPAGWVPPKPGMAVAPARIVELDASGRVSVTPCKVFGYDSDSATFQVEVALSGDLRDVPRVSLCFDAEDPEIFAARVAEAHAERAAVEDKIVSDLFVDCMPTDDVPGLSEDSLGRIVDAALSTRKLREKTDEKTTEALLGEIDRDYRTSMNRLALERAAEEASGSLGLGSQSIVERDMLVSFPVLPPPRPARVVPARGCVPVEKYDFADRFSDFSFNSMLTTDEVIKALGEIRRENALVLKQSIFNMGAFNKAARLDELQQAQDQECAKMSGYIRDTWCTKVKNIIKSNFMSVGKGWFHLEETNRDTYDFSKLKKFLVLTRVMMQDVLRSLIEQSLGQLVSTIEMVCSADVTVTSTADVVQVYPESTPRSFRSPIMSLDIDISDNREHFTWSTNIEDIAPVLLGIFDRALTSLAGIKQLEPLIMSQLFWSQINDLAVPHPREPLILDLRKRLAAAVERAMVPLRQYMAAYDEYLPTLTMDIEAAVKAVETIDGLTLEIVMEQIAKAEDQLARASASLPTGITIGFARISTKKVRDRVLEIQSKLVQSLKDLVALIPRRMMQEATKGFESINRKLKVATDTIEDVDKMRKLIEDLPTTVSELTTAMEQSAEWYAALEDMKYRIRDEDSKVRFNALHWPVRLKALVEETQGTLKSDEEKYRDTMQEEQQEFQSTIGRLDNQVGNMVDKVDMANLEEYDEEVVSIMRQLKQAEADAQLFNSREVLFQLEQNDYSGIRKIIDNFEPFYNFWHTSADLARKHQSWMEDSWELLKPDEVEADVNNAFKTFYKAGRVFQQRGLEKQSALAEAQKEFADAFKRFVPLIHALRMPGMKDRHWEMISDKLGYPFRPNQDYTLVKAEQEGLLNQTEMLSKVADQAAKEFAIEQALAKMKGEWADVDMVVMEYGETGTFIVKVEENIQQQMEDHIVMTQSMSFSPFKAPFEAEIVDWESQLNLVSDMVDAWIQLQRQWMYLQPIFASEDIQEQLPVEAKKFLQVDRMWRRSLQEAKSHPHMLAVCTNKTQLEQFIDANKQLDTVQKGLADYLETKRLAFARFFFLSDPEILQILSQTRNPLAVQDHLIKCFEAITELEFQDDLEITGMMSKEGEYVEFKDPMYPEGNVETWLGKVEKCMFDSCREQTVQAMEDYKATPRKDWVLKWPGMGVLAVAGIFWAKQVEDAIDAANIQGYLDQSQAELLDLTALVRGKLDKLQRLTLGALITIDVHARDVVEGLVKSNVSSISDFEWVSQLRYYWRDDVYLDMVQASREYGYEYLGNSPRLVITPLTDRCYMTLMSAMHQNLGGAPAGPAGTGKTETTKDLAKAMAKKCVVFNCSDSLDHTQLGKFFKGLASSGSWACFDEFNRIDLEVLSVVATQIDTIQRAIQRQDKRFVFEETELAMNPNCAIFITMNPGYAGRSELPDNLKALFRPCAMMVPDYALIAEILLYSYGYNDAKPLSKKLVTTFTLCSEQLSSQKHYDYGMRAVKSVLVAAGNLKSQFPDDQEDLLVLRSLRDVNVPKFLAHDLPLFEGIISDLFPGLTKPEADYSALLGALNKACGVMNIQPTDQFIFKVIQLYETMIVRHGLMLVGPTMGGKTMCYKALARAFNLLAPDHDDFEKVDQLVLNPKSILAGQMYGEYDKNTREWTDGILAHYMREYAETKSTDKKWIMFDGPVDAVWIEDMNTVLDDNKKLCLSSGAVIPLTDAMTMLFEVDNLEEASPATVSRCGMVYLEAKALGVEPLLDSWLNSLTSGFNRYKPMMRSAFEGLVPPLIAFVRKHCKETVTTEDHNLVTSFFSVFNAMSERYKRSEGMDALSEEEEQRVDVLVPAFVLFAIVWSVGASLNGPSREIFDKKFREIIASGKVEGVPEASQFPADRTVFDWAIDEEQVSWTLWMQTIPDFKCNIDVPFSDIIVPTKDSVSCAFVMNKLMSIHRNVLCVGETGTGKTVTVTQKFNSLPDGWDPQFITFSARTSANQTQDLLDSKVDKLRKVGGATICGPPQGKRYAILVDDMNMPMREKYGAQPPIELLRQWMDHEGWFERKPPFNMRKIVNIQFVGSMGPPGGGRNPVTPRFTRHFNYISFVEMSNESVRTIFDAIVGTFLASKFNADVASVAPAIVAATVDLYDTIKLELLPTPSKSHYQFNLRDMGRVVQGFMRGEPKFITDQNAAITLWLHESMRVFRDRLVNQQDLKWFDDKTSELVVTHFDRKYEDVVTTERIIYGDYMVPGADPKVYASITDMKQLLKVVEEYLEDYNSMVSTPMKLVMFLDAIEHVSRVCRVIRLPLGNSLLLGVGGSGRQSLTRLATYMEEFEIFQIEIIKGYGVNDWKEDLKKVLKLAGKDGKDTVFLLTDTQIVQESFLEDVNNILNSGEVPNLMGLDDMDEITEVLTKKMAAEGIPVSPLNVLNYFTRRVRQNLHCVICMSPIGDAFRRRLRMFPSLINCCTIDWFHEWPTEALKSVAVSFLRDLNLAADPADQDKMLGGVVDSFVIMHQSVERFSTAFYDELRRYNYVTPTSYLELLTTFISLLDVKRKEILTGKKRLEVGLEKLSGAEEVVKVLQQQILEKQPVLEKTSTEVENLLVVIQHEQKEAEATMETVAVQEKEAHEQAADAQKIKDEAEGELAEALPALEEAVKSLSELEVKDITEAKSYQKPPAKVLLTLNAVCVMFGDKGTMETDPNTGEKVRSYWDQAKARMKEPKKFIQTLLDFDKDDIPEKVIENITPYIENPDFEPAEIFKASKACAAMCKWARSMHKYYYVSKRVQPLREAAAAADAKYSATMEELADAQAKLRAVQDKIDDLQAQFKEANEKKQALLEELTQCQVRLDRADKLIGGLGGEKIRWRQTVEQLGHDLINVVGDIVVASGSIAYAGPFTPAFRARMLKEWHEGMTKVEVPHTPGATVVSVLEDPVQTRDWTIAGLPSDDLSIENAIITFRARRWPLMIDPQGQANKWIRTMEADKLDIIKLTQKDFLRPLENGVRFGRAVLLENVEEVLDPAIEPVLLKQTFKQGGQEVIKIGDNIIPYSPDFRLYMTTKLRNPHYPPEVSVKVSLLNFFVTMEGLEDQLLNIVVSEERPDLSEMKTQIMLSNAKMKKELKEIEDRILELLSASSGDILDDEVLISTLSQSKITSNEIASKVQEAERTEKEIDAARELYRPVALRAALLFFSISDLAMIDPMYQYSLAWFIALFVRAIHEAEKSEDISERGQHLNEYFTYSLYVNVCRSLFEKHKLTFSFMMLVKVLAQAGQIDGAEWRFLLAGPTTTNFEAKKPEDATWITDQMWAELWNVSQLPAFEGFQEELVNNLAHYKELFDSNEAHRHPLTGKYEASLTLFQRLLVLRCLRPDKCINGVQDFIVKELGQQFIEPPPFDLGACFKEAGPSTPLIFVLSPGADPMQDLWKLAEELKMSKRFEQVSLGKGQGPKAEALLREAMDVGKWVCLQNCHLAASWMPELDRIVESINPDQVNPHFRLWLTALPTDAFPVSILQNGVKMTLEPPKGLKSNLMRSYTRFNDDFIAASEKPEAWRRLLFGMCLFHAVIQDRRKYGPLGWNIRYDFTDGDLQISLAQMQQYLDEYERVPHRVIRFLTSEINYGGRVTDNKDRRLINMLLEDFVNDDVINIGYKYSPSGVYSTTDAIMLRDYIDYIGQLPISPSPEIFGLHDNADITCDQNETYEMFLTILSLQPRSSAGSGLSREEVIEAKCEEILAQVPAPFPVDDVIAKYPVAYEQSMNTVLTQECIRYNVLLELMADSLRQCVKALKGLVVMSGDLELISNSLFDNLVPAAWEKRAYPSLKPLSSWVVDLLERTKFIQSWIDNGPPNVFWISGFVFPQAFLTGTLQNYARKYTFAIDTVSFDFRVMDHLGDAETVAEGPDDGCYIHGLFVEGARWSHDTHILDESRPKELFTDMPIVWLQPAKDREVPSEGIYECPVYKTLTRKGELSTTGHSTNFVLMMEIPSDRQQKHWVSRGVALFCALAF